MKEEKYESATRTLARRARKLGIEDAPSELGLLVNDVRIKFENSKLAKAVIEGGVATALTVGGSGCLPKEEIQKPAAVTFDGNSQPKTYSLEEILTKPECEWPVIPEFQQTPGSPNYNKGRSGKEVKLIVLHTTESPGKSALNWLCNPQKDRKPEDKRRVSAHYLIMEDGAIKQLVDEKNTAWHCKRYNERSIGIEITGHYTKQLNKKQVESLTKLVAYLMNKYNISINAVKDNEFIKNIDSVCGIKAHSELDPGRKLDPGKENMELVLSSLKEYIANLPVAVADKNRLLGISIDTAVASAHAPASAYSARLIRDDIIVRESFKYVVKERDNSYSIARNFGVTQKDLEQANGRHLAILYPGDELIVPQLTIKGLDIRVAKELPPTMSVEEIAQGIAEYEAKAEHKIKSPLDAKDIYDSALAAGLDPRFVFMMCKLESGFGTMSWGVANKNPGNIKIRGKFAQYETFKQGIEGLCQKLKNDYVSKGRYTDESIVPIYAPRSDNNDPEKYIANIRKEYEKAGVLVADARAASLMVSR